MWRKKVLRDASFSLGPVPIVAAKKENIFFQKSWRIKKGLYICSALGDRANEKDVGSFIGYICKTARHF